MTSGIPDDSAPRGAIPVTATLVGTIALQTAVPPFATDMYTPAFPRVVVDLSTTESMIGLTLTAFFVGFALGQFIGGPLSDQRGRRLPILIGGLICTLGALGCALAPSIGFLTVARVVQGLGGGVASAVARAVIVDVAGGDLLARVMSVLQAIGGIAPMVAPVAGALVITVGTWREVFWVLTGFGALMVLSAVWFIPESLPPERRKAGGLGRSFAGVGEVLRIRLYVGYVLTATFSMFAMMAYIANSSYVLQGMKGMTPIAFSLVFAGTAFAQVLVSVLNARLIGRFRPRRLIAVGLGFSSAAIAALTLGVFLWGTPLLLTCAGFVVLMGSQGLITGNAGALAAMRATHVAGAAAAVQGVASALAMAVSAPVASAGGSRTAVPMILTMLVGVVFSVVSFLFVARERPAPSR